MKITKSQLRRIIKEELNEAKLSREERRAARQKIQAKAMELAGVDTLNDYHVKVRQAAKKKGVTPAEIYRRHRALAKQALTGGGEARAPAQQAAPQNAQLQQYFQTPIGKIVQIFGKLASQFQGGDRAGGWAQTYKDMTSPEMIKDPEAARRNMAAYWDTRIKDLYGLMSKAAIKGDQNTVKELDNIIHNTLSDLAVEAKVIKSPPERVIPYETMFDPTIHTAARKSEKPARNVPSETILKVLGHDAEGRAKVIMAW